MTCVRQPRKLKARVFESAEQYGLGNASLVTQLGTGVSVHPDRKCDNFCLFPVWLNSCPCDEWQVSPVMSNGDITMLKHNTSRTIGSIGSHTHEQKVAAWEVGA